MYSITLTLPGSIRAKKNSKRIFARGRLKKVLPSKAYEAWEKQARQEAIWFLVGYGFGDPLTTPVHVEAHIYYKGNRPDLSGAMESIGDCLQGVVWADDSQIVSWDGTRLHHDLKNPRTEITVRYGMSKTEEACKIAEDAGL